MDKHGSGAYLAPRGNRLHNGEDFAAWVGSDCLSLTQGEVTKIGIPYRHDPDNPVKNGLRYVEVTTDDHRLRYFYLAPAVSQGDTVQEGDVLGSVQDLPAVYADMTPHVHFEVKDPSGNYIDPNLYIERLSHG